jgi:hypothetical protein
MSPIPTQTLQTVENTITTAKLYQGIHDQQALQYQGFITPFPGFVIRKSKEFAKTIMPKYFSEMSTLGCIEADSKERIMRLFAHAMVFVFYYAKKILFFSKTIEFV